MDQDLKATISRIAAALDRLAPPTPPGADITLGENDFEPPHKWQEWAIAGGFTLAAIGLIATGFATVHKRSHARR